MAPPIVTGAPNTDSSDAYVAAAAALPLAQRALSSAQAKLMIPTISVAVAEQRFDALSQITALKEAANRDFGEISELRRGSEDAVKKRDLARSVAEVKVREGAILKEVHERHNAELVTSVSHEREAAQGTGGFVLIPGTAEGRAHRIRGGEEGPPRRTYMHRDKVEGYGRTVGIEFNTPDTSACYADYLDFIRFALDFKRSALDRDCCTPNLPPTPYTGESLSILCEILLY
ncbi:hypothetical protein B0H11DRAFT_2214961 [Mycena galericulata]|nr:hypothetical protein B0H11DRAFT_2214961 [Mycena galericulata]